VIAPFELEWMGGAAETLFRRVRGGGWIDDLPWESLDPRQYPAELVDRARLSWTDGAVGEYASAASFAALLGDLCEARAPVDLIGMAGAFVADEMLHTELNARMAMALGGAAPYLVDFAKLVAPADDAAPALARAVERAVRLCCVGEALSVPLLAGSRRAAAHPLTRAVLDRIVRDEPPHERLGWLVLEWAGDRLDRAARARLVDVALDAVADYVPEQRHAATGTHPFRPEDIAALGWMDPAGWAAAARRAIVGMEQKMCAAGLPAEGFAGRALNP
jgi:hypothetical protein